MTYHLEHPRHPRLYRFESLTSEVVVERWEGGKRIFVRNLNREDARRFYKYLRDKVGYKTFGFSVL